MCQWSTIVQGEGVPKLDEVKSVQAGRGGMGARRRAPRQGDVGGAEVMLGAGEGRLLDPMGEVEEGGGRVGQVEVNGGGSTSRRAREGGDAMAIEEAERVSGEPVSEVVEMETTVADASWYLRRGLPVRGVSVEVAEVKGGGVEVKVGQCLELSGGLGV